MSRVFRGYPNPGTAGDANNRYITARERVLPSYPGWVTAVTLADQVPGYRCLG